MVDAADLKSVVRKGVPVQVRPGPPAFAACAATVRQAILVNSLELLLFEIVCEADNSKGEFP